MTRPDDARWVAERLVAKPAAGDERYFHTDLLDADTAALLLERERLRIGILLSERTDRWALERLERVTVEIEARRAAG